MSRGQEYDGRLQSPENAVSRVDLAKLLWGGRLKHNARVAFRWMLFCGAFNTLRKSISGANDPVAAAVNVKRGISLGCAHHPRYILTRRWAGRVSPRVYIMRSIIDISASDLRACSRISCGNGRTGARCHEGLSPVVMPCWLSSGPQALTRVTTYSFSFQHAGRSYWALKYGFLVANIFSR